jgi:catechol 2,3-dioxygenase-like lactoylglutathione lyase family enzyme
MNVPARLHIVTLGVSDLARAVAFYRALGWESSPASQEEEIVWFELAGGVIGLWPREKLAEDAGLPPEPVAPFGGVTLAMCVESRDQVQPLLDVAEAAGGTLTKPATEAEWGGVSGYVTDPDGHPWEIAWNPFFTVRADGTLQLSTENPQP